MNPTLLSLPQALQKLVNAELKSGEAVAWSGQPNANRAMRNGFFFWFFFIPWTAFALFWIAGAAGFSMPDFSEPWDLFPLFGLPFLLIGFAGLSAPLLLRYLATRTVYVITNQRAFMLSAVRVVTVRSYAPEQFGTIVRKERSDGSGDIVFEQMAFNGRVGRSRPIGFYGVSDAKRVAELLEALTLQMRLSRS